MRLRKSIRWQLVSICRRAGRMGEDFAERLEDHEAFDGPAMFLGIKGSGRLADVLCRWRQMRDDHLHRVEKQRRREQLGSPVVMP